MSISDTAAKEPELESIWNWWKWKYQWGDREEGLGQHLQLRHSRQSNLASLGLDFEVEGDIVVESHGDSRFGMRVQSSQGEDEVREG
jgi:hypothetical protein